MILPVELLHPYARLPARATGGAAGLDLYAPSDFTVGRGKVLVVDSGLAVAVPAGHAGRIHGRSSLEMRGLHCLAGLVDSDYRGPIQVVFKNLGAADVEVKRGERMCQLVVQPVTQCEAREEALPGTARGTGGFGSTGL